MSATSRPWRAVPSARGTYQLLAMQRSIEVCPGEIYGKADAEFVVRAVNSYDRTREALITIANVGSGEMRRVAFEALRYDNEEVEL